MQTHDKTTGTPARRRWLIPSVATAIGITYFIAGWLGSDRSFAVLGLVLMVGIAATALLLSRFSETINGLLNGNDERINAIDASAMYWRSSSNASEHELALR